MEVLRLIINQYLSDMISKDNLASESLNMLHGLLEDKRMYLLDNIKMYPILLMLTNTEYGIDMKHEARKALAILNGEKSFQYSFMLEVAQKEDRTFERLRFVLDDYKAFGFVGQISADWIEEFLDQNFKIRTIYDLIKSHIASLIVGLPRSSCGDSAYNEISVKKQPDNNAVCEKTYNLLRILDESVLYHIVIYYHEKSILLSVVNF